MRPIRLLAAFATVGVWTLASRILGLVRDILIATFLGSSAAAEAFLVAFALPNMFRRLFAEGAFNMAFVPMYSKKLAADDGAEQFAGDAFSGLATILIALTLVAQLAMPGLVWAMAAGFAGDERFDMAVFFGRIAFPYILFISLAALLSGVLNAGGRFAAAAAAPVLLNIVLVTAMTLGWAAGWDIASALTWSVPLAGFAQFALLWIAVARSGVTLRIARPRMTPELKRLAIIAAPAALAGGVVQINLLVGRQIGSQFEGAIAWLAMADRLYQLPLGLVGVAIGVVLLPDLSRRLAKADTMGAQNAFNRASEFALALTFPAAVALMVIPSPLIGVLYERGAFTAEDTSATAMAVIAYGAGLVAFVLQKTVMPLYFSREDTRTPFRFALVAMVANAVVAIGLAPVFGFVAAAWGTTLSSWLLLWLLWRGSRHMGEAVRLDAAFKRATPRLALSALVMGVALYVAAGQMEAELTTPGLRYAALAALVLGGALVYSIMVLITGAATIKSLRAGLRG